jgi:hypothetical protein
MFNFDLHVESDQLCRLVECYTYILLTCGRRQLTCGKERSTRRILDLERVVDVRLVGSKDAAFKLGQSSILVTNV